MSEGRECIWVEEQTLVFSSEVQSELFENLGLQMNGKLKSAPKLGLSCTIQQYIWNT